MVEGDEGVLDAAGELGLVGDLPRLEAAQVVEERRLEARHGVGRKQADGAVLLDAFEELLEQVQQEHGRVEQVILESVHALKDVGRAAGDHVGRQEDAHVDRVCVVAGWDVLVQQGTQAVDALEAVLAVLDDGFLSQKDDEILETVFANRDITIYILCFQILYVSDLMPFS